MPASNYLIEDMYNPMEDWDELYQRQDRLHDCTCDTDQRHPMMSEIDLDCPRHGYTI